MAPGHGGPAEQPRIAVGFVDGPHAVDRGRRQERVQLRQLGDHGQEVRHEGLAVLLVGRAPPEDAGGAVGDRLPRHEAGLLQGRQLVRALAVGQGAPGEGLLHDPQVAARRRLVEAVRVEPHVLHGTTVAGGDRVVVESDDVQGRRATGQRRLAALTGLVDPQAAPGIVLADQGGAPGQAADQRIHARDPRLGDLLVGTPETRRLGALQAPGPPDRLVGGFPHHQRRLVLEAVDELDEPGAAVIVVHDHGGVDRGVHPPLPVLVELLAVPGLDEVDARLLPAAPLVVVAGALVHPQGEEGLPVPGDDRTSRAAGVVAVREGSAQRQKKGRDARRGDRAKGAAILCQHLSPP